MRRTAAGLLAIALLVASTTGASALGKTFTHPEIGEPLTVGFVDTMPRFKIYGFTYYVIPGHSEPMRGLLANLPSTVHDSMPTLDDTLGQIFLSAREGEAAGEYLSYSGEMALYQEALDALEMPEKIQAVRLLGGFEGAEGIDALSHMPGFDGADLGHLIDGFSDFTVRVGDARYPWRVLQFYVEVPQDEEYFFERYGFLYLDGEWRLARTSREYADISDERSVYIHGVTGFGLAPLDDIHYELMRDQYWGGAKADVMGAQGAGESGEGLLLKDTEIFRIPADAEFAFSESGLREITYRLRNDQSYYSAFISLFIRYADPVTVSENGDMTWSLNDTVITLTYDKKAPTLRVTSDSVG